MYDAETSEKAQNEFIQQVDISRGMVQQGQRIIDQGEIVDARTYNILSSLKQVTEERSGGTTRNSWMVLGQLLLILLMFSSFYMYLLYFRPTEYRNRKHVVFMVLLIVIFLLLTAVTVRFDLFSVYIIPYAIVTILIHSLVYLVERSFSFISGVTLVELSNINKPLLKELSEKRPRHVPALSSGV